MDVNKRKNVSLISLSFDCTTTKRLTQFTHQTDCSLYVYFFFFVRRFLRFVYFNLKIFTEKPIFVSFKVILKQFKRNAFKIHCINVYLNCAAISIAISLVLCIYTTKSIQRTTKSCPFQLFCEEYVKKCVH